MLPIYLLFVHVLITHSSSYTGHRVYGMSETLQPVNAPITMDVFYDHIYQRRPFLARHGSQRLLDKNLEWNTQQWFDNANYLVEIIGPKTKVRVEVVKANNFWFSSEANNYTFGPSDSSFTMLEWKTFMNWYMSKSNLTQQDFMYYLTIQGNMVHPPLEQLLDTEDVKIPKLLQSMGDALIWDSAHVWMGRVDDTVRSQSRMHADSYDNLYHLIHGKKKVILIGPNDAEKLSTYGEVKDVASDGLVMYAVKETNGDERRDKRTRKRDSSMRKKHGSDKNHFSAINPHLKLEEILLQFPLYNTIDGTYEFEMKAGDVLYIPTGWFHSFRSESCESGRHMAINFWFLDRRFAMKDENSQAVERVEEGEAKEAEKPEKPEKPEEVELGRRRKRPYGSLSDL